MPLFSLRRVSDSSAGSKASRVSARLKAKAKRALTTVGRTVRGMLPLSLLYILTPHHTVSAKRHLASQDLARGALPLQHRYHIVYRLTMSRSVTGVVNAGTKHQPEDVVVAAAAAPSGAGEMGGGRPSGSSEGLELELELSPLEVRRIHAEFWRALRVVEARGRAARPVRYSFDSARSCSSVVGGFVTSC